MKPVSASLALRLAPVLMAVAIPALGCSGSCPEVEPSEPSLPALTDDSRTPEPSSAASLGTPFVLEATATQESLAQVRAELVQADGSRLPVAARSVSFELRSDGRVAAIDRVRVELEPLDSGELVSISNRSSTVLTVLDSSPDYVRATAGLAWSLEPGAEEHRGGAEEVPVNVGLEATADGTHVRLTMTLESRAELSLGDVIVSTGPWVVQLEGDLKPR